MLGVRGVIASLLCSAAVGCSSNTIVDGQARFQIVTPSLIRFEFADDRHFEDGSSFTRSEAAIAPVRFTTRVRDNWREIETDRLAIRYLRGSGPFTADNLTVTVRQNERELSPFSAAPTRPLGKWLRALDGQRDAFPMHDGFLNRDGWYVLDDSVTAVRTRDGWIKPRAPHRGTYQDKYLFVYDHDYAHGLADLTLLSGRPPLLPRWAFGVWYSRYWPYSERDYREAVLPRFRSDELPLDVLVVDTDWKGPKPANGWGWNATLFPDGKGFLKWATGEGLQLTLNIHPSIAPDDPRYAEANRAAGGLDRTSAGNFVWNWGDRKQAASYFALHDPFDNNGVRFWWLDWCCEAGVVALPGAASESEPVAPDSWINSLYAERATARGLRGFSFARIGGKFNGYGAVATQTASGPWADRRYTVHFTGDTYPTWKMLDFETAFTVAEGATGFPYVSHDLGSFFGKHLPDDLYLRWVELGTFQPIFRLHSNHGDRLPWDYPEPIRVAAEKFMRLRESLVPYLYTLGRIAFDSGLPMTRGLYFDYPELEEAYVFKNEYLLGDALLVMPITAADNTTDVWFPPGRWTNVFTGERVVGPVVETVSAALDTMPVFARAGAIVPRQPPMRHVGERPVDPLLLDVYVGADGLFKLYEDEGEGLKYLEGKLAWTVIRYDHARRSLIVEPAQGRYDGARTHRAYQLELIGVDAAPSGVTVDGSALSDSQWHFDDQRHALEVQVPSRDVGQMLTVQLQ